MLYEPQYYDKDLEGEGEDMCWVCESWIETTLSVDLKLLGVAFEEPTDA
jgi:hypothetical protein